MDLEEKQNACNNKRLITNFKFEFGFWFVIWFYVLQLSDRNNLTNDIYNIKYISVSLNSSE